VHRHPHRPAQVVASIVATAALVVLAACTGASPDGPAVTPSGTTPTPTPPDGSVAYGVCEDGQLTLLADDAHEGETVRPVACPSVSVVGTATEGVVFAIGEVDRLVVEGSGLTVEVASAGTVLVPGSRDTVTCRSRSEVQDLGTDNRVSCG